MKPDYDVFFSTTGIRMLKECYGFAFIHVIFVTQLAKSSQFTGVVRYFTKTLFIYGYGVTVPRVLLMVGSERG